MHTYTVRLPKKITDEIARMARRANVSRTKILKASFAAGILQMEKRVPARSPD